MTSLARPESGRFERKFLVRELMPADVDHLVRLHPALFRTAYPPRWVNNVYFDTPGLENFRANIDGSEHRVKFRLRWYGDLFGPAVRPRLERKGKDGLLGTKTSHDLPPLDVASGLSGRELTSWLRSAELPPEVLDDVLSQEAVLLNRYRREYWLSADRRFRLTVDTELEFRPIGRANGSHLVVARDDGAVVVELKYDPEDDREAARIASAFPFRLTKSSKYASGIERLLDP